ncbi:hypothetical protein EHS13_30040 [Paenibacillus psychroresistens]|uniref:Uncharacterized protein n=1 Tax=Paenibacillus psychroresistens TaxID=1778678 RepID=A0A6B8RUI6_9BACL|nr:hypothetical protein [Paenibacillus psychroresistens]QGQ98818.1 hypothetical protein EHS13_30040 [Paenibacillus psychroresistens]
MVFGSESGFTPQVPATDIGPSNKSVDVNRETWETQLSEYSRECKESLILPATIKESPFFQYNNKIYPFSKENDFIAGVEGVGFGLDENGNYYFPEEKKIQIPILFYCPECKKLILTKIRLQSLIYRKYILTFLHSLVIVHQLFK